MQHLSGRVAVVTGAASGIGFALARRFGEEGMRVVLADVEEEALAKAVKNLQANGAKVLGVRTDVSQATDLEALAQRTLEAYGGTHLLFNNAGVFMVGTVWESTVRDQRATNIHVRDGISEQEFVRMREARDAELDLPNLILPSVQVNIRGGALPPPEDNGVSYLKIPLNTL